MMISETDLIEELRRQVAVARSQKAWALHHGLSEQYVNDVLHGRRHVGSSLARALGYRRIWRYERLPKKAVV